MLSNKTALECKIGERCYQFVCSSDSPLGEVHDALSELKAFVIQKIQESEKKQEPEVEECPTQES